MEPRHDALGDVGIRARHPARALGAGDGLHESHDGGTGFDHQPRHSTAGARVAQRAAAPRRTGRLRLVANCTETGQVAKGRGGSRQLSGELRPPRPCVLDGSTCTMRRRLAICANMSPVIRSGSCGVAGGSSLEFGTHDALHAHMVAANRGLSLEHAQRLSRIGDALLLGIASSAAAAEDGVFHWKVAIVLLVAATALWLLVSRALGQYSATNGRGFFGDIALTLVMVAGVVAPICDPVPPASRGSGRSLHPGRALIALLPTVLLWRAGAVGLRLWRARPGVDVLIVGIGPLGRLTGARDRGGPVAAARARLPALRRRGAACPPARARARHRRRAGGDAAAARRRRGLLRVDRQRARRRGAGGDPHVRDARRARSRFRRAPTGSRGPGSRPAARWPTGTRTFSACSSSRCKWFLKRFFDIVASSARARAAVPAARRPPRRW